MISNSIYPEYACITEVAISKFQPTWLMIKRHKITGLKYFCKTTKADPYPYDGSGTRWLPHIRKHGREHIETPWCQLFDNIYELVHYALTFSKENDIVVSKEWANLIPENGLDGGTGPSPETGRKISAAKKGVPFSVAHCKALSVIKAEWANSPAGFAACSAGGKANHGKKHAGEWNNNIGDGLVTYHEKRKSAGIETKSMNDYVLRSPTNETVTVDNLKAFCRTYGVTTYRLYVSLEKNCPSEKTKGWQLISAERRRKA